MPQSMISVTIPAKVVADAETKIQDVITALQPYIKGLDNDQRRQLTKMGDKSVAFAEKVNGYIGTNGSFLPGYVDKAEYAKDYAIPAQLKTVLSLAQTLHEMVDDTVMAAGSDIMEVSNLYHNSVKNAASNGQAGAKAIYEDLKARYPGRPSKHEVKQ